MPSLANSPLRRLQRQPNAIDPQLFLINLDAAGERREHMLAQLRAQGLVARRIGIDCRTLTRRQIGANVARRFPDLDFAYDLLSGAEIGCWMSHLSAWSAFMGSGTGESCAVIEDDVVLEPAFARTIASLASQQSYDVVFLGTSSRNLSARRWASINGVRLHERGGSIYNTWGYVIRRDYLERLFAVRPLRIAVPIDHMLGGRSGVLKPRVAVVQPRVVREDPHLGRASQIQPHTWRPDRWRLVESARRAFLESRVSDWYYGVVNSR